MRILCGVVSTQPAGLKSAQIAVGTKKASTAAQPQAAGRNNRPIIVHVPPDSNLFLGTILRSNFNFGKLRSVRRKRGARCRTDPVPWGSSPRDW